MFSPCVNLTITTRRLAQAAARQANQEPAVDDADARRLYRLVRAQTLASQMAPSQRTTPPTER